MSRDPDDELADVLGDLADTLRTLESEVAHDRSSRGPFGLPPPPTPRQVLGFTGEYAIPTAIAVLKANIKILELVGAALRATSPTESSSRRRDAVERLGGETVGHLERALEEIQQAVDEGNLPQTPEARDVVEEARRLNDDLREYIRESTETADEERKRSKRDSRTIPIEDGDESGESGESDDSTESEITGVEIDIEEELRSIKDNVGDGGIDEGGSRGDIDASIGTDSDADDSAGNDGESDEEVGSETGDETDNEDDESTE